MASIQIPASQVSSIHAVLTVLVTRYGTVDNIPDKEWERLLPPATAGAVKNVLSSMDGAYPSPSTVMRAVVECMA